MAVSIDAVGVTVVVAHKVEKLGDVREISDAFNFEGRIFMHATFRWELGKILGRQLVEVKWFNDDKLVSRQSKETNFEKSPFYLASSTSGTSLGAGKCRVELVVGDRMVGRKEFTVAEK